MSTIAFDENSVFQGTLDAVMSDKSSTETPEKMFSEYFRVLKNGGRYICITLGQDFIVEKIMDYFPNNGWLVRVHKVCQIRVIRFVIEY